MGGLSGCLSQARGHHIERKNVVHAAARNGAKRHGGGHRGTRVLHPAAPACPRDRDQAARAVVVRAGKHDAQQGIRKT